MNPHGNPLIAAYAVLMGFAAVLCSLSVAPRQHHPANLHKRALVVGVGHYPPADGWAPIVGAVCDATTMTDLLVRRFEFPPDQIVTLLDGDATREAILEKFQSHLIEGSDENTLALFYFAGHGSQLPDENDDEIDHLDETLVPINALNGDARHDIRDDELDALIERLSARSRQVVLLFDCCHSGTVHRGGTATDSHSLPGVVPRRAPPQFERGIGGRRKSDHSPEIPEEGFTRFSSEPRADSESSEVPTQKSTLTRGSAHTDHSIAVDAPHRPASVFVLSACLDYQSAMSLLPEYFGLPEERGLFTLGLERAMISLPRDASFGLLFQRLKMEMRSLFPDQNPLFLGQWDATFLGGEYDAPVQRFLVEAVTDDGLLSIAAGTAQGIVSETRLAIDPPVNSSEAPLGQSLVAVAQEVLGPGRSTARLLAAQNEPAKLAALVGSTARILERAAPDFSVRLALPQEQDVTPSERWKHLKQGLLDSPYLETLEEEAAVRTGSRGGLGALNDLRLYWSLERGFEVDGPGGQSLLPRPPFLDRIEDDDVLLRNLEKYAVWRALCVIENQPTLLEGVEVKFDFGHLTDSTDPKSFKTELAPRDAAGVHLLRPPESTLESFYQPAIKVSVSNQTGRTLYFWIMDLQPNWAIVPLCPRGDRESDFFDTGVPVRRDVVERLFRLDTKGHTQEPSSVEALKVFVSEDKVDLSYLETTGISSMRARKPMTLVATTRGGSGSSTLGKLIANFSSGTRGAPSTSTGSWMTSTAEFRYLPK